MHGEAIEKSHNIDPLKIDGMALLIDLGIVKALNFSHYHLEIEGILIQWNFNGGPPWDLQNNCSLFMD